MTTARRFGAAVLIFVVVAAILGACSGDDTSSVGGSAEAVTPPVMEEEQPESNGFGGSSDNEVAYGAARTVRDADTMSSQVAQVESGSVTGTATKVAVEPPGSGPDVIKTADVELELERDGLQNAVRDAIATAGRFGGFVLSTSTEGQGAGSGTVIIRVPAERFEAALSALEGLGKVESESVSGQDVSQEFVDLEARVRNLEAQETVLLRLMDRAQTITGTIRVQNELSGIQLEIERLTGRIRYLRDQADTSTISLHMFETGAVIDKPKAGVLGKAFDRAMELALGVLSAIIVGTGLLIPLALIALVGYLVLRALRPRVSA